MHYAGLSRFFAKKSITFPVMDPPFIIGSCSPLSRWNRLSEPYKRCSRVGNDRGPFEGARVEKPHFWAIFDGFRGKWNFFDANIFLEFF